MFGCGTVQVGNNTGFLATKWLILWAHGKSLIKNLTPFKDDKEICLLNFLMQSLCKQPEDTFIKMTSPKIDFYFEAFKER